MNIIVTSPQSVKIDGVNYGAVADAIANNRQLAGNIQLALNAWYESLQAEQQQALETERSQHATETTTLQQQLTNLPTLQSENDALKQQVQSLQSQLDALLHPPQPTQDYKGFYRSLLSPEGLPLFLMVRSLAGQNQEVGMCYTDLVSSIIIGEFPGFQASVTNLFASLAGIGFAISETQRLLMRQLLDRNGFSAIEFPVGQ